MIKTIAKYILASAYGHKNEASNGMNVGWS